MKSEVVIVRLTFGDRHTCDLVPLVLNDRGFPNLCRGAETAMVVEKERHHSLPYGTEIEGQDGIPSVAMG
jgi:hypothetical protein